MEANSSVRQGQGKEGEEVSNFVEGLHCARALAALKIVSVVIWLQIALTIPFSTTSFLDASSHLYNRLCPLVGWLVGWSVG